MFKKVFEYIKSKDVIRGLFFFGIYQLVYTSINMIKNYINTNIDTDIDIESVVESDIDINKNNINNFIYDICMENIIVEEKKEKTENFDLKKSIKIDKSIQCELSIEEMINLNTLQVKYTVPEDISNAPSRFRWFFR